MTVHRPCCCTEGTCCTAWSSCPAVQYVTVDVSWVKSARTLCSAFIGITGCTLPASFEVERQVFSLLMSRLRATKQTDGGGCTFYRIEQPDTLAQTGTMEFSSSWFLLSDIDCPGGTNTYLYDECAAEFATGLDDLIPDLSICNWIATITIADVPGDRCRATLAIEFDLCLIDGVVKNELVCGGGSLNTTRDLCLRVELVMISPDYVKGAVPCPSGISWALQSFSAASTATACSCTENCGTCIEDVELPLTVCECPWTSTCGSQAGWTCWDADFNGGGCLSAGNLQEVAWCYSADDPIITITDI